MTDAERNERNSKSGPVTVVIRRRIKSGFAQAYEGLEKEISIDAAAQEGYLGSTFLRPEGGTDRDFVTIVRFDSYEEHDAMGAFCSRQGLDRSRGCDKRDSGRHSQIRRIVSLVYSATSHVPFTLEDGAAAHREHLYIG